MPVTQYEYSRIDQLKVPQSYMYTRYEGPAFLSRYRQVRQSCSASLSKQAAQIPVGSSAQDLQRLRAIIACGRSVAGPAFLAHMDVLIAGPARAAGEAAPSCSEHANGRVPGEWVETAPALAALLEALCQPSADVRERAGTQLSRYTARFEVTKKLHAAYDAAFTCSRGPADDLGIYASLSLALMLYHARWTSLKFLNTALKVNDLLCSQPVQAFTLFAAIAAVVSFTLEQDAVARLMTEKELAHGA